VIMEALNQGRSLPLCAVCGSLSRTLQFTVNTYPVHACGQCGLQFLHPQPDDRVLGQIYGAEYFLHDRSEAGELRVAALKTATAEVYLDELMRAGLRPGSTVLEIGCGSGDFLLAAQARGLRVSGIEISEAAASTANTRLGSALVRTGTVESIDLPRAAFDAVTFFDVIEHVRCPMNFLRRLNEAVKPGGLIMMVTPSLDSWSAKMLRNYWMEYKTEHLFYFSKRSLRRLLEAAGFEDVVFRPNKKVLSLDYIDHHFQRFRVPVFTPLVGLMRSIFSAIAHRQFHIVASGVMVLALKRSDV
jgi:2-polyprenyl-3-methyl-5-hydroxy-6-metoxy-1,4-benzoquinol methylase